SINLYVFSAIGNMDGLYSKINLTWQKLVQSRATTLIAENANPGNHSHFTVIQNDNDRHKITFYR
ncbi:hypothetical protein AVEN_69985-1, partial [Araneus ventricosus]